MIATITYKHISSAIAIVDEMDDTVNPSPLSQIPSTYLSCHSSITSFVSFCYVYRYF